MPEDMSLDRLERLLEAYGANPARWPPAERTPALELLEATPELQGLRRQAAALDALLGQATLPQASDEFVADVLAAAGTQGWRQWAASIWPFGPIWKPALGLTMAAGMGAALGFAITTPVGIVEISHEIEGLILG